MTTKIFIGQWVAEPDTMTLGNMERTLHTTSVCARVCVRACARARACVCVCARARQTVCVHLHN